MNSKPFIFLVIFQLLVAQIGVNLFSSYCCCLKKTTVSFLPKKDKCFKTYKKGNSKQIGLSCIKSTKIKKGSCSKQEITFSSSKAIGYTNSQDLLKLDIAIIALQTPFVIVNKAVVRNAIISLNPINLSISGFDRRIRMSSLLC